MRRFLSGGGQLYPNRTEQQNSTVQQKQIQKTTGKCGGIACYQDFY